MEKTRGSKKGGKVAKSKGVKVSNKDKLILKNLFQNPEGLRVTTLEKLTNLKQRTLYRRLNKLRKKGLIENIFPIWKIINGQLNFCQSLLKDEKLFELHNFSLVVPLVKTPNWWKYRSRKLIKLKGWHFQEVKWGRKQSNPYQQIINENYVIQTYPESIIVIFRKRYHSNDPYDVVIQALNDFFDMWAWFEERMRFKFTIEGLPHIKLRNNDFLRVRDSLAEHCKKQGKGFLVEIKDKGEVWVDYSEPFGKEANYPEAQEILELDIKDKLLNKPMLNSELQLMVQKVTQNQLIFDKNMSSHLKVLNEISRAIKELRQTIKQRQTKLGEYI